MAKVKVHETGGEPSASAQLIKDAIQEHTVTDTKGRKIRLVKPSPLAQFRILKAIGSENAMNGAYVMSIMPLLFVADIDGEVVHFPASDAEVEAIIMRLGDDGLVAVTQAISERWGGQESEEQARAAIKKS
jgi:hypothetical protein